MRRKDGIFYFQRNRERAQEGLGKEELRAAHRISRHSRIGEGNFRHSREIPRRK